MPVTLAHLKQIEVTIAERTKHLLTRDEFYNMMDRLLVRFDKLEQEYVFMKNRVLDHEKRFATVESTILI
jgi:hypothetical protein